MRKLTVIIPTFNEERNPYYKRLLEFYSQFPQVHLIISDGGSTDQTIVIAQKYSVEITNASSNSRAVRINKGMEMAQTELVLINHPRSILTTEGIEYLLGNAVHWGGFTHCFDTSGWLYKFTSWYSNNIRSLKYGIVYLDHCIFFKKEMFQQIGKIPPVDIFEDTILSERLYRSFGTPQILPFPSTTSAIRFQQNGVLKHSLRNQVLKIKFRLGFNHQRMNKYYENKTALNADYEKEY